MRGASLNFCGEIRWIWEEGGAHLSWEPHGSVSPTRSSPRFVGRIPRGLRAGGDFATSNSVGLFLPDPDFQHLSGSTTA